MIVLSDLKAKLLLMTGLATAALAALFTAAAVRSFSVGDIFLWNRHFKHYEAKGTLTIQVTVTDALLCVWTSTMRPADPYVIASAKSIHGVDSRQLTHTSTRAGYNRRGEWRKVRRPEASVPPGGGWSFAGLGFEYHWHDIGIEDRPSRPPGTKVQTLWVVPLWYPVAFFGSTAAFCLFRYVRSKRRLRRGLCPRCGYDLRATPGRCPECGTATPAGGARTSAATASDPPAPDDPARRAA